jgi:hypothetical protein
VEPPRSIWFRIIRSVSHSTGRGRGQRLAGRPDRRQAALEERQQEPKLAARSLGSPLDLAARDRRAQREEDVVEAKRPPAPGLREAQREVGERQPDDVRPQTKVEAPKYRASKRDAEISVDSVPPPTRKATRPSLDAEARSTTAGATTVLATPPVWPCAATGCGGA